MLAGVGDDRRHHHLGRHRGHEFAAAVFHHGQCLAGLGARMMVLVGRFVGHGLV